MIQVQEMRQLEKIADKCKELMNLIGSETFNLSTGTVTVYWVGGQQITDLETVGLLNELENLIDEY